MMKVIRDPLIFFHVDITCENAIVPNHILDLKLERKVLCVSTDGRDRILFKDYVPPIIKEKEIEIAPEEVNFFSILLYSN